LHQNILSKNDEEKRFNIKDYVQRSSNYVIVLVKIKENKLVYMTGIDGY
jgi:hypothetical protein